VISFCADVTNEVYVQLGNKGAIILNIYFLLEFLLLTYYFSLLLIVLKKLILLLGVGFLVLFILTSIFWQDIHTYQNIIRIIGSVLFVTYSVLFFRYFLKTLPVESPWLYPHFLIVAGIGFYFFQGFCSFTLSRYVFTHLPKEYGLHIWLLHGITEIIKHLFFARGIYLSDHSQNIAIAKNHARNV
jgi:hypothetical protein